MHSVEYFLFPFQVRLANNAYTLDKHSLAEYETHFTVMVSDYLQFLKWSKSVIAVS